MAENPPPATAKPVSPLEEGHLLGNTGRVDASNLYAYLRDKFANSGLVGYVPPDGKAFGINTGSAEEWARFGLAVAKQESDLNPQSYNAQDPGGSAGLFQFSQNTQPQFTGGTNQFNPANSADAFVRSVQHYVGNKGSIGNLGATFGSIRRPNETLQHMGWAEKVAGTGSQVPGLSLGAQTVSKAPIGPSTQSAAAAQTVPQAPIGQSLTQPPPAQQTPAGAQPEAATAAPQSAALVDPLTREAMALHHLAAVRAQLQPSDRPQEDIQPGSFTNKQQKAAYDQEQQLIQEAHSAAIGPQDKRVAYRTNPDTGSERIAGHYFVEGDPVHEQWLSGLGPEDRAKLPWVSQGIRNGRLDYLYGHAAQFAPGEEVTSGTRQHEYQYSTAKERVAAKEAPEQAPEAATEMGLLSLLSPQFTLTKGGPDKPRDVMVEGEAPDKIQNNAQNIQRLATRAGIPVPYKLAHINPAHPDINPNDPTAPQPLLAGDDPHAYNRDLMGYLENQAHGYRGNGSGPVLDETGQPHRLWQLDQARAAAGAPAYIPHMLSDERTKFIHGALNIRPGQFVEHAAPTLRERAQWIRRTNEAMAGYAPGANTLIDKIDRHYGETFPKMKVKKDKMGNVVGEEVAGYGPFSKQVLESTWRQHHLKLMEPATGPAAQLRQTGAAGLVHRAPEYRHAAGEFEPPRGATPIGEDPMIGAPLGGGEKITHAAVEYPSGNRYLAPTHFFAHQQAAQAGEPPSDNDLALEGFHTSNGRFLDREEALSLAQRAKQLTPWAQEHSDALKRSRYVGAEDIKGLRASPAPISANPEVGSPETRFQPGPAMPGVLGAEAGVQGQAPPQMPSQPSQPPPLPSDRPGASIEFTSPNLREDLTTRSANLAFKKEQHQNARDFHDRLEADTAKTFGYEPAVNSDVAGDWKDGTENSIATRVPEQHASVRKLVNSIKGLHGAQKQTALFRHDPSGPDNLYSLELNTASHDEARDWLTNHGLDYRTIEPGIQKGEPIWAHIIDQKGGNAPKAIVKMLQKGLINQGHDYSGHASFPGDPYGESREAGAREFRRGIQEARSEIHQAQRKGEIGGVLPPDESSYLQDYEDEAERNYQELRKSDLYQDQEELADLKRAARDRQDMTPAERRFVKQTINRAKNLEANKLGPRTQYTAHKFLSGGPEDKGERDFPEWVKTKADIAKFFNSENPKLDFNKQEHREIAIDAMHDDVVRELARGSEGPAWYKRTIGKSLNEIATEAPKILTDPEHQLAFKLSTAITSQGQEVHPNFESNWMAYRYWEKHHKMPTDPALFGKGEVGGGPKFQQMIENFEKVNKMWKDLGTKDFVKFLETPMSMRELKEKYGTDVSGELMHYVMEGAAFLGPKIGAFFNNLNQRFHTTVFDLWNSRTINRIGGNMFGFSPTAFLVGDDQNPAHVKRLEALLDSGQLNHLPAEQRQAMRNEIAALRAAAPEDRDQALALAPTIHDWARATHKEMSRPMVKGGRSYPPEKKNEMTSTAKALDEGFYKLADAPRNGQERENWRAIYQGVKDKLTANGIKLTHADLQAVLWWMEQKLFMKAGSRTRPPADYLDAAHRLTRKIRTGLIPRLHSAQ